MSNTEYLEEVPGVGIFFVSGSKRTRIVNQADLYVNYKADPKRSEVRSRSIEELKDISDLTTKVQNVAPQVIPFYLEGRVGNAESWLMRTSGE